MKDTLVHDYEFRKPYVPIKDALQTLHLRIAAYKSACERFSGEQLVLHQELLKDAEKSLQNILEENTTGEL